MLVNQKPKLLYIAGINPVPSQGGGELRVYKTIISLSKFYSLTVLLVAPTRDLPKKIIASCEKIVFFSTTQNKSFRPSIFGQPYWFSEWFSHEILLQVAQLQKINHFEAIQIDGSQLLYLFDALPQNQPTFFTAFDIATISFWRRNQEQKNFLKRILGYFGVLQVYLYERKFLPKAGTVLVVSAADQNKLKQLFQLESKIIPNAYDLVPLVKKTKSQFLRLGFIGGTSHTPNRQAIAYLVKEIASSLRQANLAFKVVLAGSIDPTYFLDKTKLPPEVTLSGSIPDVAEFYKNIDVLVAPIRSGSGTRIKILESLAYQTPVITTPIGSEGIYSQNVYLARTLAEFNSHIMNFSKVPFEKRFKPEVASTQTWEQVFKDLHSLIQSKL